MLCVSRNKVGIINTHCHFIKYNIINIRKDLIHDSCANSVYSEICKSRNQGFYMLIPELKFVTGKNVSVFFNYFVTVQWSYNAAEHRTYDSCWA